MFSSNRAPSLKIVLITIAAFMGFMIFAANSGGYGNKYDKAAKEAKAQSSSIVAIAAGNENFSTLVAAIKAADLVDTLSGDGPFTVFAPTNDAFAKLPEGTLEMLLKPENKDKLVGILTYHVVSGEVMAKDVVNLDRAETVQGSTVAIQTSYGDVMVDQAKVTQTDIDASNGVIHVIDSVIVPEAIAAQL